MLERQKWHIVITDLETTVFFVCLHIAIVYTTEYFSVLLSVSSAYVSRLIIQECSRTACAGANIGYQALL